MLEKRYILSEFRYKGIHTCHRYIIRIYETEATSQMLFSTCPNSQSCDVTALRIGKIKEILLSADLLVKCLKKYIFYQNLDRKVFTHVTDI